MEALLAAVRTRQRRQLWLEGALLGAGALLVLGLVGGFLGWVAPTLSRWVLLLSPLVAVAVACAVGVLLSRRMVGDDARTARLVGARRPELSLDVLAAVELLQDEDGAGHHSKVLASAFLNQMDRRARAVDPASVVDGRRLRIAVQVLGAIVLVVVAAVAVSGGRWRAGVAKAWEAGREVEATAQLEPITGDIEVTYRYPAYTGLAQRTVPGTNGEVGAPAGTEVVLKTRSDREVVRAEIVVNDQALPLQVEDQRDLRGSFIAKKSGHYHFVFYGKREKPIAVGPDIAINVEADAPPQVALLTPASELEVDPDQKLTLKYEATDDYGLGEVALVIRTPGSPQETRVPLPREDGRRNRGTYTWDLNTLKVKPGDRITYHVEARDNDTVEGPKRGVSRTQTLRIYSAAEHRRAALQKAEALWFRMLDHLADRLESPDREKQKALDLITAGQKVDSSGQQLMADLRGLAQELSRERDVPHELVAALLNIAESLSRKITTTMDFRRLYLRTQRTRGEDWGTGARLTAAVDDEIAETEKHILYLEALLDRHKLEALKELAEELNSERRELARLIEQYKLSPSDEARQQVMQQIQELRERINELMKRMAEMQKGIRDEHLNAEALTEMMKDRDVKSALDDVERLMREGKVDEALAKLQELSMQMDQMMETLNKSQREFGGEQYPELAQKYDEFMNELQQTLQEQQRVADTTRQLRDQSREQNRERLTERGKAMKEDLLRKVEEVQESYKKLAPEKIHRRAAGTVADAQSELKNLENALKADAFDLAADAAQRSEDLAQQLAALGEHQRKLDEMFGNPEEAREQSEKQAAQLQEDANTLREVNEKLQSLFPEPGSQLGQKERQQLQQLSEQQGQLEQRAQGLRQQMEEMQQIAPVFGQEAGEQMEEISQRMGEAAQRMEGQDPGRGYGQQQAALEGLKRFQQQMRESQQGGGQGGLPLPMGVGGRRAGNGRDPRDKVEIPDEEAYQAPKEFRKDLLDAMKQGAPERYREQVKRYYEELVK